MALDAFGCQFELTVPTATTCLVLKSGVGYRSPNSFC